MISSTIDAARSVTTSGVSPPRGCGIPTGLKPSLPKVRACTAAEFKKGLVQSKTCPVTEIKDLDRRTLSSVKTDLKKIVSKRKNICGIKFNYPQIMGVLNITPDSFSDGGLYFDESQAYDQANLMMKDGAAIIDVGGESTRPGSKTVNDKDEWDRIKNTIIKLKKNFSNKILSLDTRKSYVMKKGIECGIDIINDVSGLNFDKKSFNIIKSKSAPFILHHMQGKPNTMQKNPKYDDALLDIYDPELIAHLHKDSSDIRLCRCHMILLYLSQNSSLHILLIH